MKRSSSASKSERDNFRSKRSRPNENHSAPSTREYLQLALARIVELQRQISEGVYVTDETSDLGESESDEDITKEVLTKVFKDLPGSSEAVSSIIDSTSKPSAARLRAIRDKSVQLSGFEACRRLAVDFVRSVGDGPDPTSDGTRLTRMRAQPGGGGGDGDVVGPRPAPPPPTDFEASKRMLGGLDLHLAAKQRDYTARLMSE